MHPVLIDLGLRDLPLFGPTHLFLPTYGVLFALSALAAWAWFMRRVRTLGVDPDKAFNATFYGLLAGILGAKLTLLAVEWRYYVQNPIEILGSFRSAGVLLGGIALGTVVFIAYARKAGLPYLELGDAIAAPLALAQAFGRLGCASAGCCYGIRLVGRPWYALVFTDPLAAEQTGVPLHVPLFPVQLVQMLNDLVLAGILTWLWHRARRRLEPPGTVFWWYLLLYGSTRAVLEFWRGDVVRGVYFGGHVSTSQLLAMSCVAFAAAMLTLGRMRGQREAPTP